jgi:hypothetical protein
MTDKYLSLPLPMAAIRGSHLFMRSAALGRFGSKSDFAALSMNGGFELQARFCPLRHSIPKMPD